MSSKEAQRLFNEEFPSLIELPYRIYQNETEFHYDAWSNYICRNLYKLSDEALNYMATAEELEFGWSPNVREAIAMEIAERFLLRDPIVKQS